MRPAGTSGRAWIVLLLTVVLGLTADLASKSLAFRYLGPGPVEITRQQVLAEDPSLILGLIPEEARRPVGIIPGLLDFQLVLNSGAVFGTGSGKRWFFIGFTVVALLFAVSLFAFWTPQRDHLTHVAIGLVIAGGIGNLYDRLRFACVRDFIHPLPDVQLPFGLSWPSGERDLWPYVSNVADALLLIGIGILMIVLWRADARSASKGRQSGSTTDDADQSSPS